MPGVTDDTQLGALNRFLDGQFATRSAGSVRAASWHEPASGNRFVAVQIDHFGFPAGTSALESNLFVRLAGYDLVAGYCLTTTREPGELPILVPSIPNTYVTTCAEVAGVRLVQVTFAERGYLGSLESNVLDQSQLVAIANEQVAHLHPSARGGRSDWRWILLAAAAVLLLLVLVPRRTRRWLSVLASPEVGGSRRVGIAQRRPRLGFAVARLRQGLIVMFAVTFGTTMIAGLLPGDVVSDAEGPFADFVDYKAGYKDSLWVQYWHWLDAALHGNLGQALHLRVSVDGLISNRAPVTIEIAILTLLVALAVAVPAALVSAGSPGGSVDRLVTAVTALAASMPVYISGIFVVDAFALTLRWFPSQGWTALTSNFGGNLRGVALPVVTLTLTVFPVFLKVLRGDLVALANEDFVVAARSRGVPEWYILLRHMLRPAAASLVTYMGIAFGTVVSGSFLVEYLFTIPGLGYTVWGAVGSKDLPILQGVVVITALTFLVLNALIDLAYHWLDPRVRIT